MEGPGTVSQMGEPPACGVPAEAHDLIAQQHGLQMRHNMDGMGQAGMGWPGVGEGLSVHRLQLGQCRDGAGRGQAELSQWGDEVSGQPQADDLSLPVGELAILGGPTGDDHARRRRRRLGCMKVAVGRMVARGLGKIAQQVAFRIRQGRMGGEAQAQHSRMVGLMIGAVQNQCSQGDRDATVGSCRRAVWHHNGHFPARFIS